jgi:hypothetical protein
VRRAGRHRRLAERRSLRRLVARLGQTALPPHHCRARAARRRPLRALDGQSPPGCPARRFKRVLAIGVCERRGFSACIRSGASPRLSPTARAGVAAREVRALFRRLRGRRPEKAGHCGARCGHPGAAIRLGAAPRRSGRPGRG